MQYCIALGRIWIISVLITSVLALLVVPDHNLQQVFLSPEMSQSKNPPVVLTGQSSVIMSDVMSIHHDISLFAEFARASESITNRLDNANENTTVLAPLNSVVKQLPRKPWEDPEDSDFTGQAGEDRAARNLERFVEAHVIPLSPFQEKEKVKTLTGREIWWEQDGDSKIIRPDGIKVKDVRSTVANGQIWTIEGIINYSA